VSNLLAQSECSPAGYSAAEIAALTERGVVFDTMRKAPED
jgi:hypothetical protein